MTGRPVGDPPIDGVAPSDLPAVRHSLSDPLWRYRLMANIVGAVLIVLVFIAVPLRYIGGHPTMSKTVSPIHGALYLVLVSCVYLLGRSRSWSLQRTVLVALAGTIPILSFYAERRVTRETLISDAQHVSTR